MMENGSLPAVVGGVVVGGTFKKETNRIDFPRSVPTWVFSPLKAGQAELIDFNYIDLQLLIVVTLSQASLGQMTGFPYSKIKPFLFFSWSGLNA